MGCHCTNGELFTSACVSGLVYEKPPGLYILSTSGTFKDNKFEPMHLSLRLKDVQEHNKGFCLIT